MDLISTIISNNYGPWGLFRYFLCLEYSYPVSSWPASFSHCSSLFKHHFLSEAFPGPKFQCFLDTEYFIPLSVSFVVLTAEYFLRCRYLTDLTCWSSVALSRKGKTQRFFSTWGSDAFQASGVVPGIRSRAQSVFVGGEAMVKNLVFIGITEAQIQALPLTSSWPWAMLHLASLCLALFICKIGMMVIVPTHEVVMNTKYANI